MHKFNPLNTDELFAELFDIQHGGSVFQFQKDFSAEVFSVCELIKQCYVGFLQFENLAEPDEQFMFLSAHVYAMVESLYTSIKLLTLGFLAPSGNQFRVALEALAYSILLSCREELLLEIKQNKWVEANFFEDFLNQKRWTRSHLVIKILDKNKETLGLSTKAVSLLNTTKELYNHYSHATLWTIRTVVVSSECTSFGGGYDREQKALYKDELSARKMFIEKVPGFLVALYEKSVF